MEEEFLSRVAAKEQKKQNMVNSNQEQEQLIKQQQLKNLEVNNNSGNGFEPPKTKNKKPFNLKRFLKNLLLCIVLFIITWIVLLIYNMGSTHTSNGDFNAKNIGSDSAVTLVLGVDGLSENDQQKDEAKQQLDDRRGVRADSIMLLASNPNKPQMKSMSVYRDLLIQDVCSGQWGRLNATFANGWLSKNSDDIKERIGAGASCMKKSLEKYFGFEINNYIVINFSGFEQIINAVGGVDIDVIGGQPKGTKFCEQDKYSTNGNPDESSWNIGKYCFVVGEHRHLSGDEALAYARHRHSDNDQWRTMRQSQVMASLVSATKSPGNIAMLPFKTFGISSAFTTNINSTDTIMYLLRHLTSINSMEIQHINLPFVNNVINGTYYLNIPEEDKNNAISQIKNYLEN